MRKLRGWISTGILAITILFTTTSANAGIIYGAVDTPDPCKVEEPKVNSGIIYGLTGIIYGLTGIIYGVRADEPVNCGIIVTD